MPKKHKTKRRKKKIGQITTKKIGKKYAVCISGTPEELFNTAIKAIHMADKLRKKHGRRIYGRNRN